jgi:hypothetical protein
MLAENTKIIWAAEPKSYSGTAVTKKYVNMANYNTLTVLIITGAWAGGTAAVTMKQATSSAGANVKALAFAYQRNDVATGDTLVNTAVTSDTFNLGTANKIFVIEVQASDLDINNGFKYVSVDVASPGANADFYGAVYILGGARYAETTPPAIA